MGQIEKTVFISYRRKDMSWALLVYKNLTANGFDVFFDFTSIASGDFEQIIISNIKARAHFLIVLTPTALDRCNQPGDWLRREIETAISEKRNIIPLFFDSFNFGTPSISDKLSGKLVVMKKYNGLDVPASYFDAAMERLRNRFLNTALDAVLHPISSDVQKVIDEQKIAANKAMPSWFFGDMEFVKVPRGKFLMGSSDKGKQAYDNEKPQHTLELPYDFLIARFPVTNEQFAVFAKETKLKDQWGDDPQTKLKYPVGNVTWKMAVAFCDWMNQKYGDKLPRGVVFRLPTEAEWEKAARWKPSPAGRGQGEGESLIFPWGNDFDSSKCNTRESGIGATTPIGAFSPQGDSPYGASDMAGNVWEWTASLWGNNFEHPSYKYPYNPRDGRENLKASTDVRRVLRGGSFEFDCQLARCSYRWCFNPHDWYFGIGFRVAASPA